MGRGCAISDHPTRFTLFVSRPNEQGVAWVEETVGDADMTTAVDALVGDGYTIIIVPRYWHAGSKQYMTVPGTEWTAKP